MVDGPSLLFSVNSHVVRQNRISFVEQEVLRHKQQEEDFRREREMRSQELMQQGKSTSPSSLSPPSSTGNSRLQSPTSPEPPAAKSVKSPTKPTTSKAKAVYQVREILVLYFADLSCYDWFFKSKQGIRGGCRNFIDPRFVRRVSSF